MANVFSNVSFDYSTINMNRLISKQTDFAFYNNAYETYNGKTYQDVAVFEYYHNGYIYAYFGGSDVVFNSDYSAVLAGTATGIVEQIWSGSSWSALWGVEGFSYSAVSFANAIHSSGTSDDFTLLSNVLSGNDTFSMSAYADVVRGYAGNDVIYANAGNDKLFGDTGNDTLNGGTGADTMLGGAGNDTYYVDNTGDRVFETTTTTSGIDAGGTDTVYSYLTSYTLGSFVENGRIMSTGTANLTGNGLSNTIYAGKGSNVLSGGSGTDTLSYAYGANGTTGVKVSLATTAAQSTGGSGTDTISGFERLTGSANNDSLTGNSGANILRGGSGNDTLTGSSGTDTLYGDSGNDLLRGGTGNDILYGGTGQDIFRFDSALGTSTTPNIDQIKDFSVADDTIQLENAIFTALATTGTLASGSFVKSLTGNAVDSNDRILYETDTGKLYYDADGSGVGAKIQFATLALNLSLTNADFVVI